MANSYIRIRCKHCGEHLTIAGYYPSLNLQSPDSDVNARVILNFINEHLLCHPRSLEYAPDLGEDPGLEFIVVSM